MTLSRKALPAWDELMCCWSFEVLVDLDKSQVLVSSEHVYMYIYVNMVRPNDTQPARIQEPELRPNR